MDNEMLENNFSFDIHKFLNAIKDLARILHVENQLMEEFKFDQMTELRTEKEMIVDYLENSKKFIASNPDIIRNNGEKLLKKIKKENDYLNNVSTKNGALIEKLIYTNRKIVEIVTKEFNRLNVITSGYNNKGSFNGADNEKLMPPVSLKNLI